MGKSLYSLMLNDEVVSAVDRLAARQGLTRSAMVNMILAEYAGVLTPEKRINDIFTYIESVFGSAGDIIPQVMPNQQTMSLKSSLDYKYRPSIRYDKDMMVKYKTRRPRRRFLHILYENCTVVFQILYDIIIKYLRGEIRGGGFLAV